MIWRLSGWSSTTKMRLLMPFPPVARSRLTHSNVQMKTRLRGLPFQYQQCHHCIRYACGEGWLRSFSPPAGSAEGSEHDGMTDVEHSREAGGDHRLLSGHCVLSQCFSFSLTMHPHRVMSALPPKADISSVWNLRTPAHCTPPSDGGFPSAQTHRQARPLPSY